MVVSLGQLGVGEFHLLVLRCFEIRTETGAAASFVHSGGAHDYQLAASAETLGVNGRSAADDAHRGELGHLVSDGP